MYIVVTMNMDRPDGVKMGTSFVEKISDGVNMLSFINYITHGLPANIYTFDKKKEAEKFAESEYKSFEQSGQAMIAKENNMYTVSKHTPA